MYFWLKDDLSPAQTAAFIAGVTALTTIDTVQHALVGVPAPTDRPIIDRSYSYGLVVAFKDMEAHDAYQVHAIHDTFRETCGSFWSQVKIYDQV
mgnify:CR=1 FL=1